MAVQCVAAEVLQNDAGLCMGPWAIIERFNVQGPDRQANVGCCKRDITTKVNIQSACLSLQ